MRSALRTPIQERNRRTPPDGLRDDDDRSRRADGSDRRQLAQAPRSGWRRGLAPYLQATPLALILGVFLLLPIVMIVVVSFWDYDFARIYPGLPPDQLHRTRWARGSPGRPISTR